MVVKTKVCSHCRKKKATYLFHKKLKSKDGLQEWCKECKRQASMTYHIKAKERKYHSLYERLRYYKNNHGLSYKLLTTDKSSGSKVRMVKFTCLNCGAEVVLPLGSAASRRFVCDGCLTLIGRYNKCNSQKPTIKHSTGVDNKKSNVVLIGKNQTDLLQELKKQYPNANIVITFGSNENKPSVTHTPNCDNEHSSCKCSQNKGIFSWLKSLLK